MNLAKRVREALKKAVDLTGNQLRLEEKTGVKHSTINMMSSGKRSTGNMTVNTLEKLFPEMEITFFRDERQSADADLSSVMTKIMTKAAELDEDAQLELIGYIAVQLAKGRVARKHSKSA